jgi:D-beta-D-heptose 7-phosphate kinase/D-beta-D-heptose 1-phosphate adenosyltransferase
MELRELVEAFAGCDVVVVGDVILDVFADGACERLCREAPVPVVELQGRRHAAGGAANAAANLAALGARTAIVSVVGDDLAGVALRALLDDAGVDTTGLVVEPGRATRRLERLRAAGHLLARLDEGDRRAPAPASHAALLAAADERLADAGAVVVSDYEHGTVTPELRALLGRHQAARPRPLVVDAKHVAAYRHLGVTAVKPNWSEAQALLGSGELDGVDERAAGIAAHGDALLEQAGAHIAAVTLDREGAVAFERGRPPHRTYVRPHPDATAVGAGDTFVAAFTLALVVGATAPAAAEVATRAAELVCAEPGTTVVSRRALLDHLDADHKLRTQDDLRERLDAARADGQRVVFANGCFDLLHRGHITFLNRAKTLGDVLVVGVNDDDGVARLKGAGRPILPLPDRLDVLAALSCVDHLVVFADDSAAGLVEQLHPDVYAKGGDYTPEMLPETALVERLGGEVVTLGWVDEHSTDELLDRIRATAW